MPNRSAGSEVSRRTRFRQRQHAAFAHPGAEQISRIARVAQHVHVRAAVAEADQDRRVVEQLGHAVDASVERRHA